MITSSLIEGQNSQIMIVYFDNDNLKYLITLNYKILIQVIKKKHDDGLNNA